jgi:putative selenium metabolism hydrolase
MSDLDKAVSELAAKYRPLAVSILKEVVRIPADHVDRPDSDGGDPSCGLSNHEGPRLEVLKKAILDNGCVARPEDVGFDEYGNLVWSVEDPDDPTPRAEKKVIYLDGHTDTVKALRSQWQSKIGGGIDCYDGWTDDQRVNREFLRGELGWLPPDDEWEHMVFGRGSADQLSGVVSQVVATKILLETIPQGSLRGAIVRSYATVTEEDNDGAGPMYLMRKVLPTAGPEVFPDAVLLTEGTGDANKGALGIYRGQRGRMQIEVVVTGRSCHGSMPWEGKNPLEFGGAILAEAAQAYERGDGFLEDPLLGRGTRTASWAVLESPSDCAVPDRFTFRFDRRLTAGETPDQAVADIDKLAAVKRARDAGLTVEVGVPTYNEPTWKGYHPDNPQIYMGWVTPEDHPAIAAARRAYKSVVSPAVPDNGQKGGTLRHEPRVDRWIFSTDGVGFPVKKDALRVPDGKNWVDAGEFTHPPMLGMGPGIEQNTHKIGEAVDARELQLAIAAIARFPSAFVEETAK